MGVAGIIAAASASGLVLLLLLFRHEDKRDSRYLEVVRTACDDGLSWIRMRINRLLFWTGAGNVRLFLHALLHYVLRMVLYAVRILERFIETRVRRNRRKAKVVSRSLKQADHLQQLAEHRASTALNEDEKRKLRSLEK